MLVIDFDQRVQTRFWARVDSNFSTDCWPFLGAAAGGYGRFGAGGRIYAAHRVAYTLVRGPIPEGKFLDHLCRNRACCNPAHLEPVTNRVNTQRGAKGWDLTGLCRNGLHDMGDPANIRIRLDGQRLCRPCYKAYYAEANRRALVRVPCPDCGMVLLKTNLGKHRKRRHQA